MIMMEGARRHITKKGQVIYSDMDPYIVKRQWNIEKNSGIASELKVSMIKALERLFFTTKKMNMGRKSRF